MSGTDPIPGGVPDFRDGPPGEAPLADELIGKVVMGYTVTRVLGAGAMGAVYEGSHRLGGRAALKILHASINTDPELRAQFEHETRILFKLDNTHVVKAFGYEALPDGRQCLLMAFHENTPLDQVLAANGGSLPLPMAIAYGWQILDGLEAAHAAGVWHRDLKPSNVLQLKESTQVEGVSYPLLKIVDFGIAHDSAPTAESVAQQIHAGTPDYLSPEQAARGPSDGRSDLYSLGVMLFEMISGTMPFEGTAVEILRKHRFEAPPKLSRLVGSLPDGLDPLIDQLLEKEPAKRPATATEVKRELWRMLKLLHGERTNLATAPKAPVNTKKAQTERVPRSPPPQDAVSQPPAVAAPARRSLRPVVGAGLLLLVGAGLALAFWPAPSAPTPPTAEPPPRPGVAVVAPDRIVQPAPEEPPKERTEEPTEDLEPLLPLPATGTAPAPKKPARRPAVPAPAAVACVPDAAWKAARGNDLQDLTKLAAQNGHMDEFEQVEPELGRKVREATAPADCASVGRQIDGLIKRYHRHR